MGEVRNQIYLGDEEFVEDMQARVEQDIDLSEVPSAQRRRLAAPIVDYLNRAATRNEGIYLAFRSGSYSMKEIAGEVKLHYSSVSKIIKSIENS